MSGTLGIAAGTIGAKSGDGDLAAPAADIDAANRGGTGGNASGAARACGGRNAAVRIRIRTVFRTRLAGTGACAGHAATGALPTPNAVAGAGAAGARCISSCGRHGE